MQIITNVTIIIIKKIIIMANNIPMEDTMFMDEIKPGKQLTHNIFYLKIKIFT